MPAFTTLYELLNAAGSVLLTTAGTSTASGYEVTTWSRPDLPERRQVEQSPYIDGEVETASVLDVARLVLQVRVVGTSYADLQTKYDAMVTAAKNGPDMKVRVTIAGTARTWQCTGRANIAAARVDRDGDGLRWSFREEYRLDWPVNPTPS